MKRRVPGDTPVTTHPVKAVHDDDLKVFLQGLGILEDVKAGRTKCAFCKEAVTLANLHAVYPDSGDIKVVCGRAECVRKLLARLESRRYDD